MRYLVILIFVLISCKNSTNNKSESNTFEDIHSKAIFVDSHNDILLQTMEKGYVIDDNLKGKTHSDLDRMKKGGLDVQFFSVWSNGNQINPYNFANIQIDSLDAVIKRNPKKIVKVSNTEELLSVVGQNKIAALIGLEGGHQIEDDLNKLDSIYNRGVRYLTLTWNNSTKWATSASDETKKDGALNSEEKKGLTQFGKEIINRMNKLGIIIDVSHVGEQTFWDVITNTKKPIIASHSSVYNICPHHRNLKDNQIKAIAKNDGVIQINFSSGFLDSTVGKKEDEFLEKHKSEIDSLKLSGVNQYLAEELMYPKYRQESEKLKAPFNLLIDHIEYIIKLVGIDYVGIGSDFDGMVLPPKQLNDVTKYPLITKALLEKGYSEKDIAKILGGNILRVLKANE
ncbi:dipeptidase [Siansivirga zeaxanthinifaciens]|uniref:Dipeptidase n=1 Tax=Siansivirga zeaxanthinifaciens CC-SAMT-1 TaxID=1454006 RepID=A0A0C5VW91_9FLAO|nr:dipeptidase [Siansivirga zeaxanthinifaciens]AJR03371.1 dipeptidase [Siansivirga zeaxanthinifaciens CC-SAMT-1]